MSIASEIQRLQQAKADIAEAIVAKGGEVSGTLDTYAQAIEALPSGGDDMSKLIDGSITALTIPTDIRIIRDYAYRGLPITEVDVPANIENIKSYAFSETKIQFVTLHEGLISIGNFAFFSCSYLQEITIPKSVTGLGTGGNLRGCPRLQRVKFLGTVNIPNTFFQDCSTLDLVDLSNCTRVVTLSGTGAFNNVPKTCEIRVPSSLYDRWITATNWSTLYAQGYNFVAV